jgi:general stress protein 26
MNSIDQQQPERNHEDLSGAAAIRKIRELVKHAPTCFFSTAIRHGRPVSTRPMNVRDVDEQGRLWFLSAKDSRKNIDIAVEPTVQLYFQGSAHADFLTIHGRAHLSSDKAKIKELWQPILKTWFTGGIEDPRIEVIRVDPVSGYYWDTKHNRALVFAKMVAGAIMGKTLDDSIQGTLNP